MSCSLLRCNELTAASRKRKPLFAVVSCTPTRDRRSKQRLRHFRLTSSLLVSAVIRNSVFPPSEINVSAALTRAPVGERTRLRPGGAAIVLPVVVGEE